MRSPEQLALGPDAPPGLGREAPTRAPPASREGSEEGVSASLRAPGELGPHRGLNNPGKVAPANPPGFLSSVKMDSESSHTAPVISITSPPRPPPPAAPCDAGTVSTSWMKTQARDRPRLLGPPSPGERTGCQPPPWGEKAVSHATSCSASTHFHGPSPRIQQGLGVRIQGQQEPEEPQTSPHISRLSLLRQE